MHVQVFLPQLPQHAPPLQPLRPLLAECRGPDVSPKEDDPILTHMACLCRGLVSTNNSGGFASVRCRNFEPALDCGAHEGIELRLKVCMERCC